MSSRDTLLAEIEAFLRGSGMSATRFGETIMNDRRFVARLRNGGDVTLGTADRVRRFMICYRHKEAA